MMTPPFSGLGNADMVMKRDVQESHSQAVVLAHRDNEQGGQGYVGLGDLRGVTRVI